jgi:hypothetical protein
LESPTNEKLVRIPETFVIVRTKAHGLHYVDIKTGTRLKKGWLSPAAETLVSLTFREITGAQVTLETSQIESLKVVSSSSIASEVRLTQWLNGDNEAAEPWMLADDDDEPDEEIPI